MLVTEGFIEPQFLRDSPADAKSILPGICSAETVNENHFIKPLPTHIPRSVLKNNPVHEDMVYAARKMNVQFTFNVALDAGKKSLPPLPEI